MYATCEDYERRYPASDLYGETLIQALEDAGREIDALTFNRISSVGLDSLTPFQRRLVSEATCEQAEFRRQYGGMLSSPLSAYSINGVSMQFDGPGLVERGGTKTSVHIMALLRQTGLTYTGLDGRRR